MRKSSFLILVPLFFPSLAFANLVDVTSPELLGLTISPNVVDVTAGQQTVDVSFEFTDDLSGLNLMWLDVYNQSGTNIDTAFIHEHQITGDGLSGILETQFTIPQYAEEGDYTYAVYARDNNNNAKYFQYDELVSMGFGEQLSVLSASQDVTSPELLGLTISPNVVDVTAGQQTVDVSFEFTDDLSGLNLMWLDVYNQSGTNIDTAFIHEHQITGDGLSGILETQFTIPQYAEEGDYTYAVYARDNNNNAKYFQYDELVSMGFGEQLSVLSASQDVTSPELLGLTISPNVVDVTAGQQTVDVSFEFTDDLSGLNLMWLDVYNQSGTNIDTAFIHEHQITGDGLSGILETQFTIPQYAEEGDYTYAVYARDNNNNVKYFQYDELVSMGFGEQLSVGGQVSVDEPPTYLIVCMSLMMLGLKKRKLTRNKSCVS